MKRKKTRGCSPPTPPHRRGSANPGSPGSANSAGSKRSCAPVKRKPVSSPKGRRGSMAPSQTGLQSPTRDPPRRGASGARSNASYAATDADSLASGSNTASDGSVVDLASLRSFLTAKKREMEGAVRRAHEHAKATARCLEERLVDCTDELRATDQRAKRAEAANGQLRGEIERVTTELDLLTKQARGRSAERAAAGAASKGAQELLVDAERLHGELAATQRQLAEEQRRHDASLKTLAAAQAEMRGLRVLLSARQRQGNAALSVVENLELETRLTLESLQHDTWLGFRSLCASSSPVSRYSAELDAQLMEAHGLPRRHSSRDASLLQQLESGLIGLERQEAGDGAAIATLQRTLAEETGRSRELTGRICFLESELSKQAGHELRAATLQKRLDSIGRPSIVSPPASACGDSVQGSAMKTELHAAKAALEAARLRFDSEVRMLKADAERSAAEARGLKRDAAAREQAVSDLQSENLRLRAEPQQPAAQPLPVRPPKPRDDGSGATTPGVNMAWFERELARLRSQVSGATNLSEADLQRYTALLSDLLAGCSRATPLVTTTRQGTLPAALPRRLASPLNQPTSPAPGPAAAPYTHNPQHHPPPTAAHPAKPDAAAAAAWQPPAPLPSRDHRNFSGRPLFPLEAGAGGSDAPRSTEADGDRRNLSCRPLFPLETGPSNNSDAPRSIAFPRAPPPPPPAAEAVGRSACSLGASPEGPAGARRGSRVLATMTPAVPRPAQPAAAAVGAQAIATYSSTAPCRAAALPQRGFEHPELV